MLRGSASSSDANIQLFWFLQKFYLRISAFFACISSIVSWTGLRWITCSCDTFNRPFILIIIFDLAQKSVEQSFADMRMLFCWYESMLLLISLVIFFKLCVWILKNSAMINWFFPERLNRKQKTVYWSTMSNIHTKGFDK